MQEVKAAQAKKNKKSFLLMCMCACDLIRLQRYKKAPDLENHSVKSETRDQKNGNNPHFTSFCNRLKRFCKVHFAKFKHLSAQASFRAKKAVKVGNFSDEMGDFGRTMRKTGKGILGIPPPLRSSPYFRGTAPSGRVSCGSNDFQRSDRPYGAPPLK